MTSCLCIGTGSSYDCSNPQFSDSTGLSIVCDAPAGVGADHDVFITLSDGSPVISTDDTTLLSYDVPTVSSVAPSTGAAAGAFTITLTGSDFGGADFGATVTVDGQTCASPAWVSDSEVTCTAPAWAGADNSVVLTVGGQSSAANSLFSYDSPGHFMAVVWLIGDVCNCWGRAADALHLHLRVRLPHEGEVGSATMVYVWHVPRAAA